MAKSTTGSNCNAEGTVYPKHTAVEFKNLFVLLQKAPLNTSVLVMGNTSGLDLGSSMMHSSLYFLKQHASFCFLSPFSQGEFVEDGTETHFSVGDHSCYIKAVSSGKRKEGIIHTLIVDDREIPEAVEQPIVN